MFDIGNKIPSFQAKDSKGNLLTDQSWKGQPLVIYFYPKDNTPGCTKEACGFRDHMEQIQRLGAAVVGVSPDHETSHQSFIQKYKLNFPLLVDENKEVCERFGVLKNGKLERSTFLIDREGVIRWVERPVKVSGHIERVLEALHSITA